MMADMRHDDGCRRRKIQTGFPYLCTCDRVVNTEGETPLAQALDVPWSREVIADENGGFVASVPELPGCFADGASPAEALENLEAVLADWLEDALKRGDSLPEPRRLSWTIKPYRGSDLG